ncbi:MAG: hypothetical protein J6L69_10470 [Lachnospiraceae bacterium]|nr:hypothetical protein [Lachnospiraceae bacterium]
MSLVEKLRALAKAKNTSFSALEKELGFGNGTIQKWDNSSPSCDKLLKLANFLNTSIDSLLRDEPINEITNTAHEQLINLYDKATSQDQLRVINYLELANSLPLSQNLPYNPQYPDTHSTKSTVMRYIPLRGHVAAGKPIEAIDMVIDDVELTEELDADYALIVNGNSMHPIIKDGEYVFVKSTKELNNNDIGVFYYNGNVTCKKFFKNDVMIKLISLNPTYEDFVFYLNDSKNEYINFKIEGKVLLSNSQAKRLSNYFTFNR